MDSGSVEIPVTRSACVSKALMSCILAYIGSASKDFTCSHTIADSSMSAHMTLHYEWFKCNIFKELDPSQEIYFQNNSHVKATSIGTVMLEYKINGHTKTMELKKNTLYIPSFQLSLISIHQFNKARCYTVFKNGVCKIKSSKEQKVMLIRLHKEDLYYLNVSSPMHALAFININMLY